MKVAKRVLVTGGTGFIGASLLRHLHDENHKVFAIVRHKTANLWRIKDIMKDICILNADLTCADEIKTVVKKVKPEVIFHLAAYGSYPSESDLKTIIEVNFLATVRLLEICSFEKFECFVNTGSSSEYGSYDRPMSEEDTLRPLTSYGASKAAATIFCSQMAQSTNLNVVTLRPFSVYGPFEEPFRLIPTLMKAAVLEEKVQLASKKSVRDFVYAEDVVDAYMQAASAKLRGVFNIGSGREFSVESIFQIVNTICGGKLKASWGHEKSRTYELAHWRADLKLSRRILGWKPKHDILTGLTKTYNWFQENLKNYHEIY